MYGSPASLMTGHPGWVVSVALPLLKAAAILISVTAFLLLLERPACSSFHSHSTSHLHKSWGPFSDFMNGQKHVIVGFYITWWYMPITVALFKTSGFIPPHWYQYCDLVYSRCWEEGKKKRKKDLYLFFLFIFLFSFSWSAPNVNNVCR